MNGGTCVVNRMAASCICSSGYTGVQCDQGKKSMPGSFFAEISLTLIQSGFENDLYV